MTSDVRFRLRRAGSGLRVFAMMLASGLFHHSSLQSSGIRFQGKAYKRMRKWADHFKRDFPQLGVFCWLMGGSE